MLAQNGHAPVRGCHSFLLEEWEVLSSAVNVVVPPVSMWIETILSEMASGPVVWIIDSQQWPRACLRAELMERGFEVMGFESPAHTLRAHRRRLYEEPLVVILELFALDAGEGDIAAVLRLGIPTLLLGGAVQLNQGYVKGLKWASVLRRPFTIGKVADTVENLMRGS